MQKWEYMGVAVFGPGWSDNTGKTGTMDGLLPRLNELGSAGWELAGAAPRRDDRGEDAYTLFFKRPKA